MSTIPSSQNEKNASESRKSLLLEKHKSYIINLDKKSDSLEYVMTDHLRMSGVYWGLTAMAIMNSLEEMEEEKILEWLINCKHDDGSFGGNINHDGHLLYTLSAIQILVLYDKLHLIDIDIVASYVSSLQHEDGSFAGDEWGEIDTRFSYCAIACLALIGRLDSINLKSAVDFIASCQNFDGGFGSMPGGESHAGQIFCCVGALAIAGSLHVIDFDLLGWWLAERQVPAGGLNGRPEKLPDVCYSWWVLSCMSIIDRIHWMDKNKLQQFILDCQDEERGGISDRPNDMVDVFHTFFGIAGLSLLGYEGLEPIDPAFALPVSAIERVFSKHNK